WMLQLHADAAALAQLSPDQLRQPDARAKLNDLFTMANYSFTGHFDPDTGQIQEGVSQIHYNNLRLATFDVAACSSGLPNNPCM
ncbi:MAG: hypothetical protein J2P37_16475, partial [Ktedonobacteraceae bacterium]|nr:hypothetical protein [Ktedonobacteraceae bacterium]